MSSTAPLLPASIARRAFLAGGGVSVGAMALSSLLARSLPAATSEMKSRNHSGIPSSAPDQTGDLALYVRRAVALGDVRLQARVGNAVVASQCLNR